MIETGLRCVGMTLIVNNIKLILSLILIFILKKFHSPNLQPEVEEVENINIDFMSKTLKK